MTNVRKNSAKLTREDLKIAPESPTMELSETPAVEPSDQTRKIAPESPTMKLSAKKVRELEFTRPTRPKLHKSTFLC